MKDHEDLPDLLRCNRTDGRQWRCRRRVLDDKKLCEVHYLQGRHRQFKQKVPDSLKLERKPPKQKDSESKSDQSVQFRAEAWPGIRKSKRKRSIGVSEALDETLKKMKLKKGDLQLELIRGFLKRQVEKTKEKQIERSNASELTRQLPNGVMAISPSPSPLTFNNAGSCNVKLGLNSNNSVLERCFRSKNIEPLPIGTLQVLPSVAKLKKAKRKSCHWCRKSNYRILVKCSSCRKQFFCEDCIEERQFVKQEVQKKCPVCNGSCSCRVCAANHSKDKNKDLSAGTKKIDKIQQLYYLIRTLLPVLKEIIREQSIELEIDCKTKGQKGSEVGTQKPELDSTKLHCCNNCQVSIVDLYRSCANCSYNLCLNCCSDLRRVYLPIYSSKYRNQNASNCTLDDKNPLNKKQPCTTKQTSSIKNLTWEACDDGSIPCPPVVLGGCAGSILELRSLFPSDWIKEIGKSAEEIVTESNVPESSNFKDHQHTNQIKILQGADPNSLENFQKHWVNGQPVVQSVIRTSDLSWDPLVVFCTYLEKTKAISPNDKTVRARSCLDWCEVEISNRKIFMGSLEGQTHANLFREALKFRCWLSSYLFQEQFPAHYCEIIKTLPLQEYINPVSGLLNLAVKLEQNSEKDVGPCISISYGSSEELVQSDFMTRLSYDPCDVINILVHTTDVPVSREQLITIKSSLKKYKNKKKGKSQFPTAEPHDLALPNGNSKLRINSDESQRGHVNECGLEFDAELSILTSGEIQNFEDSDDDDDDDIFQDDVESSKKLGVDSSGAQWDIFRRQDVPNLLKYLRKYSNELSQACSSPKHVVHPILDQTFFLDSIHKLRLKEEFNVEPWTFEQHNGEAVIIPAGCPYQVRKLKSCVNVVMEFISPESASECVKVSDELRLLPLHHKARKKFLEVKKRTLYCISNAIEEIHNLNPPE